MGTNTLGGTGHVSEGFDRGRETGSSSNARLPGGIREYESVRERTATPNESDRRNQAFGQDSVRKVERNPKRGGFFDREYKERIDRKVVRTAKGKAKFEAVKDSKLSPKQKAEIEIARDYGYELYHVPYGTRVQVGDTSEIMDSVAFAKTGTNLIFAQDGTELDYIYHELFHKLYGDYAPLTKEIFINTERRLKYESRQWQDYWDRCKAAYGNKTNYDIIYEEIACDLCEYAMSGSEKMYDRLNGLFEGEGTLETLAEQAREMFRANRRQEHTKAAGSTPGRGRNRYFLEQPERDSPQRGEFSRLYAPDSGTSERLQAMAAGYDADTAEAFAAGYDGTLPLTSYQTAFDYFRTQAKQGIPLETAEKNGGLLGQLLAPESRRTAYQAGLRESAGRGNIKMDAEERSNVSESGVKRIPKNARDVAHQIKNNNNTPPKGYKGGRVYQNNPINGAQKLPKGVNYREYDIYPYIKGQGRGTERIVIGDDGSVWYTNDHYQTFQRME